MEALIYLAIVAAVAIGFAALDRWHKRKAWRDANRWARGRIEDARRDIGRGAR